MTIIASTKISDLTGEGVEYLVDDDANVRLKFYNGNIVGAIYAGDTEPTLSAYNNNERSVYS